MASHLALMALGALLVVALLGCGGAEETPPAVPRATISHRERAEIDAFWQSFRAGDAAVREGRPAEAIELLERAITIRPGHEASHQQLATARLSLGDPAGALAALAEILEHDPRCTRAHLRIGALLSDPHRPDLLDLGEAAEHFTRALDLNRQDSAPPFELGRVRYLQGDLAAAIPLLEAAARQDFRGVEPARVLARALADDGRTGESVEVLERVLAERMKLLAPKGMTAEGQTEADRGGPRRDDPALLPVLDDLRRARMLHPDAGESWDEAVTALSLPWPAWSPPQARACEVLEARAGLDPPSSRLVREADLDGDGLAETIEIDPVPWESALVARASQGAVGSGAVRIVDGNGRDTTSRWFGASADRLSALPVRCATIGDFDGDGRTDLFLGCGSEDPFEIHPDIVLLQTEARRFEIRQVVIDGSDDRGSRGISSDGAGWLLVQGHAFSGLASPAIRIGADP